MNTNIEPPTTRQWLRYWRNSLADAESGQGVLKGSDLKTLPRVGRGEVYQDGRLPPEDPVLAQLFADEPESTRLVRVSLRPVVYKAKQEHAQKKQALLPEVVTPLICVLWVSREGALIPAEPPVIPRDLLSPQADDCFTLGTVEGLDSFLTQKEPNLWSQQEAMALLEEPEPSSEVHEQRWKAYYDVSRQLFEQLVSIELLNTNFEVADEACLLKIEQQANGAAQHILKFYDWLGDKDRKLALLDSYALSRQEGHRPCADALAQLDNRLGHANTAYPMATAQRDALAQVMAMDDGEILAVNGPPGTGKTTFVLSVVASLWVKAALEESEPPLIIAASTNNQAVTNILAAFAKDFEENDSCFSGHWLPDINSYGGFYPSQSDEAKAAKHYQTPSFYRKCESPAFIVKAEAVFLKHARHALDDESLESLVTVRKRLHAELAAIRTRLTRLQSLWQRQSELKARLGENADAEQDRERQALQELRNVLAEVGGDTQKWKQFCADESLWLALFSLLPFIAKKRRWKRELFIEQSLGGQANLIIQQSTTGQPPEAALQDWLAHQQQRIAQYCQRIDERKVLLEERDVTIAKLRAELPDLNCIDSLEAIDQSLDTTLRFTLFQLAVHYWEARWLEDCHAQEKELAEQATKNTEKTGLKAVRPRWRRRMKLTPCIVSTFHSLPSNMIYQVYEGPKQYRPEYLINEIDLLIVDEAGQVSPEVAGASFALAKRGLVIGDVQQIPPISNQIVAVDVGNLAHQQLLASTDDYGELRDTGRSVVDGSAMRIAQVASRYCYLPGAEPGMFLREHRRCLNEIIDFCNDLCYRGRLLPMRKTPAKDSELPPFGYVHVDGLSERPVSGSRINKLEAETLAEWLAVHRSSLEQKHGQPLATIVGVVTPFKAQAQLIEQACRDRDIDVGKNAHEVTVGTVHALQGAERPVVLFSAVYSRHDDGGFIDRDPSMLNVAVSRAKDSFLVFGDMEVIDSAAPGTPRHLLSGYLLANEENALTFAIDTARPDLLAECGKPHVINDADEHDACIRDLLERVRHCVALVSPWLLLKRLGRHRAAG